MGDKKKLIIAASGLWPLTIISLLLLATCPLAADTSLGAYYMAKLEPMPLTYITFLNAAQIAKNYFFSAGIFFDHEFDFQGLNYYKLNVCYERFSGKSDIELPAYIIPITFYKIEAVNTFAFTLFHAPQLSLYCGGLIGLGIGFQIVPERSIPEINYYSAETSLFSEVEIPLGIICCLKYEFADFFGIGLDAGLRLNPDLLRLSNGWFYVGAAFCCFVSANIFYNFKSQNKT